MAHITPTLTPIEISINFKKYLQIIDYKDV